MVCFPRLIRRYRGSAPPAPEVEAILREPERNRGLGDGGAALSHGAGGVGGGGQRSGVRSYRSSSETKKNNGDRHIRFDSLFTIAEVKFQAVISTLNVPGIEY